MNIIKCTNEDYGEKVRKYKESIPHDNLESSRKEEAERVCNGVGTLCDREIGGTIMYAAMDGDICKGVARISTHRDIWNLDHISAYHGAGGEIIMYIIEEARTKNITKITLSASGDGVNAQSRQESTDKLVSHYAKFGFKGTTSSPNRMEYRL